MTAHRSRTDLLRSTVAWIALVVAGVAGMSACGGRPQGPEGDSSGQGVAVGAGAVAPPANAELLDLGMETYARHCAACHGEDGRGEGEASYLLYPKPRDFTAGKFSLVSTWDGLPTDGDLFGTISRGMPGSAMPSWAHLPEQTRWALVHKVKSFAERPWEIPAASDPESPGSAGTGVVIAPPEPAYGEAQREKARGIYEQACAACHGPTGRGDGAQEQFDEKGFPTRPRDFTLGVFKGVPTAENVYRRIVTGMPGTPMPASDWAHGEDAWHLSHYVLEKSSDAQRERAEMKRFAIIASRVDRLPDHPDGFGWTGASPVNLHLMPLWWRPDRPEELTVRAVHDGREIAVLLTWTDGTHDHTAIRVQDFRDAVAIQWALDDDPPFFAMGWRGSPVNIWMWKSERQADMEPAFQDLDKVYPNIGIDSYPNMLRSPLEQPARRALTLESDPTFVTGWGAGNIVSDPTSKSPVENLRAEGFGTLRALPGPSGGLAARGLHSTGSYRVMFRRQMHAEGDQIVSLSSGRTVPVAFAVWNGSAGDRDGKKSVTIWQDLVIEP